MKDIEVPQKSCICLHEGTEEKEEDKKDIEVPQMGNQGGGSDPENQSTDAETSEEGESEEPSMGSSGSHGGEDVSEEINIDDVLTDESLQEKLKEVRIAIW